MRKWYDERGPEDAPPWCSPSEAWAWACGYNAAVRAYDDELAQHRADLGKAIEEMEAGKITPLQVDYLTTLYDQDAEDR